MSDKVTETAPERIWLQVSDDVEHANEPFPNPTITHDVSWCSESVLACEVAYVRADLHDALRARVAELEVLIEALRIALDKESEHSESIAKRESIPADVMASAYRLNGRIEVDVTDALVEWMHGSSDPVALFLAPIAKREAVADGFVSVPKEPTEAMWGGIARDLIMWMDMNQRPTYKALFKHMDMVGRELPQELFDQPIEQIKELDHVPSKGTRAVLIYRSMLAASQQPENKGGE